MYEINGIVYAGSNDISKITAAKVVGNYMLLLTFSSSEKRIFDATQLTGPAYEPLKDIKIFENFKLSHGWMKKLTVLLSICIKTVMNIQN